MKERNKNRLGYKETKVGWIPEDWALSKLGNAEHFLTSGSRGWSQYYSDSGALFVRITNLTRESVNLDYTDCRFVDIPINGSEGIRTRLHVGDILISITADLGIIAHFSDNEPYPHAYVNQHVALFRLLDENIYSKFVAYQLASPRCQRRFRQITDQGAKAGLNLPAIRSFPTILPSLPEQEAIAKVLECWDKAIRGYEKKIEKKRNIKKGLMRQLLSGKKRLPGFGEKWQMLRVRDLFRSVSEKAGNKEGELLSVTQDRGAIPRFMLDGRVMSPESGTSGYKVIKAGDFIVSLRSFQGGLEYSSYDGFVSPAYSVLRPAVDFDHEFYKYFFKSYVFIGKYLSKAVVGIRDGKQISVPVFATVELPFPSIDEQQAIATLLSSADAEISALERKLTALRDQKRFLLNNLVTGTIRLPQFVGKGKSARRDGDRK